MGIFNFPLNLVRQLGTNALPQVLDFFSNRANQQLSNEQIAEARRLGFEQLGAVRTEQQGLRDRVTPQIQQLAGELGGINQQAFNPNAIASGNRALTSGFENRLGTALRGIQSGGRAIEQGFNQRERDVLGRSAGIFNQQRRDINQRFNAAQAGGLSDLVSRGLGGSTLLTNAQRGFQRDRGAELGRLAGQQADLETGLISDLRGDTLGAQRTTLQDLTGLRERGAFGVAGLNQFGLGRRDQAAQQRFANTAFAGGLVPGLDTQLTGDRVRTIENMQFPIVG